MTTTLRVTDAQIARVRCAAGHSGNTKLVALRGNTLAECQGCGTVYTAQQIAEAKQGVHGQGGVILR